MDETRHGNVHVRAVHPVIRRNRPWRDAGETEGWMWMERDLRSYLVAAVGGLLSAVLLPRKTPACVPAGAAACLGLLHFLELWLNAVWRWRMCAVVAAPTVVLALAPSALRWVLAGRGPRRP